ncbi:hypothetical protein BGW38_004871 [Lunasporangiospora selenospora]|uniref:Glutathione S-transferase n=1 Tax=Lunasporangiospora selenospora TaxID=979761 RepID=A0A9P6G3H3_9FUNG|nr:hypothetical protein BGW38_004871 [Lunasporangiospora selenospora]
MSSPHITLYSNKLCPYAARTVIALEETGHPHETVEIDILTPRPEWYLKEINPYGQVPALKIDGQQILLESLITAEYVIDLHPEFGLMPKDPLQLAQTRYLIHHYNNRTVPLIHNATASKDGSQATQLRQELLVELKKVNELLLHRNLGQTNVSNDSANNNAEGPFFLGEKFTFADLILGSLLARFFLIDALHPDLPSFQATIRETPELARFVQWKDAVIARPSVQKATPSNEVLKDLFIKKFMN